MCALAPTAATETLAPTVVIVTEVKMSHERSIVSTPLVGAGIHIKMWPK